MKKVELIQYIGNEICEGCDVSRDCGLELSDCPRFENALSMLDRYLQQYENSIIKREKFKRMG